MKNLPFIIIASLVVLVSCTNTDQDAANREEETTDTTTVADDTNAFQEKTLTFINGTSFSQYAKSALPQLDWSKFTVTRFWKEDFVVKSTFEPGKSFFEEYGTFIRYAPDSSRFIDLDSYNVSISKDKNGRLVGEDQGPDTEVSLVDPVKKERVRLIFLGPGNSVEDAAWIDNNSFVLFGLQQSESGTTTNAAIWRFDLATKMVYLYELPDADVAGKWKNYSQTERLKTVHMR